MFERAFEIDFEMIEVMDYVGIHHARLRRIDVLVQPEGRIADDERPLRLVAQESQSLDYVVDHVLEQKGIAQAFRQQPPPRSFAALGRKDRWRSILHRKLLPLPVETCKDERA